MAETKLLPCPFCSGDARSIHRVNTNVVTCTKCGASVSQSAMGEGDADDIWNTRPQASRIAELEKALQFIAGAPDPEKMSGTHLDANARGQLAFAQLVALKSSARSALSIQAEVSP